MVLTLTSMSVAAQESNGCVNPENNGDSPLIDLPFVLTGTPLLGRFGFAFGPGKTIFCNKFLLRLVFHRGRCDWGLPTKMETISIVTM
jgi:hypothetical protein